MHGCNFIKDQLLYTHPKSAFRLFAVGNNLEVYESNISYFASFQSLCNQTHTVFKSDNIFYQPIAVTDIYWNFETFLIDHTGVPVYRTNPYTDVASLRQQILELLAMKAVAQPIG